MSGGRGDADGMTAGQARTVEFAIIGLCLAALVMIFQPFSLRLYGIGAALAVVGGLAFNLVPLCRPGTPARALLRAAAIVLTILLIAALLGMGSAKLYGVWLEVSRG